MIYGFRHHSLTGSIGEPSRSTKGARTAVTFLFLRPFAVGLIDSDEDAGTGLVQPLHIRGRLSREGVGPGLG